MTTEHRKAPRRKVVEISRVGAWGNVVYEHRLECGHTERRPRAATSESLACAWCLRSQAKELEIRSLASPAKTVEPDLHHTEVEIARIKAKISHTLNVALEQVEVSVVDKLGEQKISGAVVFLSESDVRKLIG
jgi:hypothetical protein